MTLFRYPGPCGLALFFAGRLPRLAPADLPEVFLSARPVHPDAPGAWLFGSLAVLRPQALHPRRVRPQTYLADNGPVPADTLWLPPSLVTPVRPNRPEIARRTVAERGAAIHLLADYLEELDDLRRSGLPGPGIPWLCVPAADRRKLLTLAGVRGRFTDRVDLDLDHHQGSRSMSSAW